ncbi:MAG: hypothetical protein H0U66_00915 [Gemmatimonadaceae bacterium]|nr:hypothetical protein [Gemmatimonadaceae bacterium]
MDSIAGKLDRLVAAVKLRTVARHDDMKMITFEETPVFPFVVRGGRSVGERFQ